MLLAYASLGLLAFATIDGLNALRSSRENVARSWAIAMVLRPVIAGGLASLVLIGPTSIPVVSVSLPTPILRLAFLMPAWALLLYLSRAWRRSLAGDRSQRVSLSRVLLRPPSYPHRIFAIVLVALFASPTTNGRG